MTWGEAFARAGGVVAALILWLILAGGMLVGGVGLLFWALDEDNGGAAFFGGLIAFAGLVLLLLSGMAVWIKAISDAVTDNVERRLSSKGSQLLGREQGHGSLATPPKLDLSP
jgi:hypothetical protein